MKKPEQTEKRVTDVRPKLIEGEDFYFEGGLMVLTAEFLRKRGYCCSNECRHCPYPKHRESDNN